MSLFPSIDEPGGTPPLAAALAPKLRALAARGVLFGTSSWKYEGWLDLVYTRRRYETRGKLAKTRFERDCLEEYATVFPTVCGDFAFYQFPSAEYWKALFEDLPETFRLGLKVPEHVTVPRWPGHARYGRNAGQPNEHFLDADLFRRAFLKPLEPYRDRVGPVIFEFGTFATKDFPEAPDFFSRLGPFLGSLPEPWEYAVEIRNADYLSPAYFDTLRGRNVAHVFNAWTRMPALDEQTQLADAFTADFTVVRALLTKGRTYEAAVKAFEPYDRIQEPNEGARRGITTAARWALDSGKRAVIYVNNRLEGCAPVTIDAVAGELAA